MPAKLLIVDDDKVTLKLVESAMTAAGYEAHTATNGADALKMADKLQPDWAIRSSAKLTAQAATSPWVR